MAGAGPLLYYYYISIIYWQPNTSGIMVDSPGQINIWIESLYYTTFAM